MRVRGGVSLVIRMMLANNARAGWWFDCPGPEIPHPSGGHTHQPRWIKYEPWATQFRTYASQADRGILFP